MTDMFVIYGFVVNTLYIENARSKGHLLVQNLFADYMQKEKNFQWSWKGVCLGCPTSLLCCWSTDLKLALYNVELICSFLSLYIYILVYFMKNMMPSHIMRVNEKKGKKRYVDCKKTSFIKIKFWYLFIPYNFNIK